MTKESAMAYMRHRYKLNIERIKELEQPWFGIHEEHEIEERGAEFNCKREQNELMQSIADALMAGDDLSSWERINNADRQ